MQTDYRAARNLQCSSCRLLIVKSMQRVIAVIFFCLAIPFLALAQTEETMSVSDTLSSEADLYSGGPSIIFPGLEFGEEEFGEYFASRFENLASVSLRPEFSFVPETGTPYTLLYSYGGYGTSWFPGSYSGAVALIPASGFFHWMAGRNEFDLFNFYSSEFVYGGAGFLLAPNIELNAAGVAGASIFKDGTPIYQGGLRMSLVVRPSDNASVMVWGQYLKINSMFSVPAAIPGGFQRMSVGASAKFKVGNATFGVGASVSAY